MSKDKWFRFVNEEFKDILLKLTYLNEGILEYKGEYEDFEITTHLGVDDLKKRDSSVKKVLSEYKFTSIEAWNHVIIRGADGDVFFENLAWKEKK